MRGKVKEQEEETVEAVNLPNISLPLTSLPKFDFVVPPAAEISAVTSTFKFASPIVVTENARTCFPKDNFTFSEPLSAVGKKDIAVGTKINCVDTSIPNCPTKLSGVQFVSECDSKVISSKKDGSRIMSRKNSEDQEMCFGIKPATELAAGSVMDILGKKPSFTYKTEFKEVSSSSSNPLDKFKPASGVWECASCLIHNRSDAVKCVSCKNSRTSTGPVSSTTAFMPKCPRTHVSASRDMWECGSCHVHNLYSATVCSKCLVARTGEGPSQSKEPEQPAVSISGLGNKFKSASETWECGTCVVRNRNSLKRCHACETERPVLAAKSTPTSSTLTSSSKSTLDLGFGDKFKKPPGSWDCPDCMLQNKSDALNCVACQKAKPGSESQPAIKLSFGIDKANVPIKGSDNAFSSNMQGFQFGETRVVPASEFSFGVTQAHETKGPTLPTKPTFTPSAETTVKVPFTDTQRKSTGVWDHIECTMENDNDLSKPEACEGARPGSESHSAMKYSFGVDKANVSVKEFDNSSSSNVQGFTFGETKVTTSDSVPRTAETRTSAAVSISFSSGSVASSPSTSETVAKPPDSSSFSQTGFCFGIPQLSQFPLLTSSEGQKLPGGVPKKCLSSDPSEMASNLKGDVQATAGMSTEHVTSTHTKQIEKSEDKDHVEKKVIFSFDGGSLTSEKPNTSTKTIHSTKSGISFAEILPAATSTDVNSSLVKPTAAVPSSGFTSSEATFGGSTTAAVTTSSNIGAAVGTGTTTATFTAASDLFTFGSTKSCVTFGGSSSQPSASTSGSTHVFGTTLKTVAPSMFTFGPNVSNKETAGAATSNILAPSFVPVTSTAAITAFGPLTMTATVSPSLSSFASATTTPNFNLGARDTVPAFGTPSTSTGTANTISASFGSVPATSLSAGFASHEQKPSLPTIKKSTTSPAPFAFGSSLGQKAPFPFGSVQNDHGLANKGAFNFGPASSPVANSGFGFMSNNQVPAQVGPAFSFGPTAVTTSSTVMPSLFQATTNASGIPFGALSSSFGANNPGSSNPATTTAAVIAGTSTPTLNFGPSSSQPSSNVFGFTANQATGSTNVSVETFTSSTSNFNFNQPQPAAQPSLQPVAPTFDPSVRPNFNFSKGETPSFT
jgi:hypothetical protein